MSNPRTIRRLIGGAFLAVSLLMLILGQTVLDSRLDGTLFIRYWLICFSLTGAAALVALMDILMIKRETKAEQEDLLNQTLHEIEDADDDEKD
ncbi:MAG: hypothetical protein JWM68_5368 [Verrucomicrobiales bacterium]|nr:hypothetical protein [Verrucomicrobiales bacterium]